MYVDKLERCTDVSVCGIAIHKRLNCTTSLADAPQHCYSSVSIPLPPGQEKKDQIECAIVVFRHFLFYRPPLRWIDDALHFLFERLYLVLELEWLNIEELIVKYF